MDVKRIRDDFPLFRSDEGLVYLDSACQSLRPRQVIDAMDEYYLIYPGCGGRSVHRLATRVSIKVDEARERMAEMVKSPSPDNIVFTKSCTEAMNTVAKGLDLKRGDVVLTTDMEHNSNHVPWVQMKEAKGIRRRYFKFETKEDFDMDSLITILEEGVRLVSIVQTNNVSGTSLPIEDVIEVAHDHGSMVMVDGAQAVPHMPVDLAGMDADFYCWSVHKMLGPAGMGCLYGKDDLLNELDPLITGGGAVAITNYDRADLLKGPERFEAGLQNYSGIIGSGAAAEYLMKVGLDNIHEHEVTLNRKVTDHLIDKDGFDLIGPRDAGARGGIISFNLRGMNAHDIAMILDEIGGVLIRSGMHCVHPYFLANGIEGCARASFYLYNDEQDCLRFLDGVDHLIEHFTDRSV